MYNTTHPPTHPLTLLQNELASATANFGVSQSRKEAGLRDVMRRHVTSFCSFIILGRFRFSTIYYEVS